MGVKEFKSSERDISPPSETPTLGFSNKWKPRKKCGKKCTIILTSYFDEKQSKTQI